MSTTMLAALLDRAADADAAAFAAFYDDTIGEVYLLARLSAVRATQPHAEAERIVRDAYRSAWRDCGSFREAGLSPRAWLLALVRGAACAPKAA